MSNFGDYEPEDAWHPDDPVLVQIDNLLARLLLLAVVIHYTDRDRQRVLDLRDDLAFIRSRING